MSAYGILVCGGSGTRMGAARNKTLLPVRGVPACVRAFRTLARELDGITVVVRAGEEALFSDVFARYGLTPYRVVPGGADRQASVYQGLMTLPGDCDTVLVHDGARPLVSAETVRAVLESAKARGSGVASTPVRDTIKRADEQNRALNTLARSELRAVQTPQGFSKALLLRAHAQAAQRATDDAALVEALGEPVFLVDGNVGNIKLTGREDVAVANALCAETFRVGHGYDAHRLVEGRALVLCGVTVPFEKGLLGHSDADVALHALMDALLGAAALYDIGRHFPDTDARYAGISSLTLLEKTAALIKGAGFSVANCDVTIIAQAPKLAPFIEQMRLNTARALQIDVSRVSVKATTTERMGFEGRGEGISALASALLMPDGFFD